MTSRSNVRQIVFPRLDSEYRVEAADANAGRGMTIHNLHCSEVSRWPRERRKRWHRCVRRWCRRARSCWSPRRTGRAGFSTKSGRGRTRRGTRSTFSPGGMRRAIGRSGTGGDSAAYRRRERIGEAARTGARADCMAAQAMGDVAQPGGTGICGGSELVFSGFGRVRV